VVIDPKSVGQPRSSSETQAALGYVPWQAPFVGHVVFDTVVQLSLLVVHLMSVVPEQRAPLSVLLGQSLEVAGFWHVQAALGVPAQGLPLSQLATRVALTQPPASVVQS